ncbi:amidase [Nocardia arthritidis]|uniref:amidase n=1 Tax=Nocardia arthritidis TaxID=228602 RepID=A0A6G9YEV7_9NOCA|nr:amidase [Nocardia arthritidis]QIS11718.1 amidase [Nocardia arthritidis]
MTELAFGGVAGQADAVRAGRISAVELTEQTLARIERWQPRLNAFTRVLATEALEQARALDAKQASGQPLGPLHGVPMAVKDEADIAGVPTTFGGAANTVAAKDDSAMVARLRAAGAVFVGKTALPEFGTWPFTESSANGYTRNPWDPTRSPGGSSGGSAAAVAAGIVAAATAGDGGGSIRIPAAWCGLFGLKPQRGRISTAPHRDLWRALGVLGVLTRSVADSALLYGVLAGGGATDRWQAPEIRFSTTEPERLLRIAVTTRTAVPFVRPAPECAAAVRDTAETLAKLGHHVEEFDPHYPDATAAFLPQFVGGIKEEADLVARPDLLERRTRAIAAFARVFTPEPVLRWAEERGERVAATVNRLFDTYDLLLTPVLPQLPLPVGQLDGVGVPRALLRSLPMTAYTALWNVTGNPAAAVPAGFAPNGLPLSIQLIARPNAESTILSVAAQLEQARPWAEHWPV